MLSYNQLKTQENGARYKPFFETLFVFLQLDSWPEGSLSPDFLQRIRSRNQLNRGEADNTSSVSDLSSDGYRDQDLIFWDYIGMFFVVAVPLATYLYLASMAS